MIIYDFIISNTGFWYIVSENGFLHSAGSKETYRYQLHGIDGQKSIEIFHEDDVS